MRQKVVRVITKVNVAPRTLPFRVFLTGREVTCKHKHRSKLHLVKEEMEARRVYAVTQKRGKGNPYLFIFKLV